jgi:hypothetical protein
MPPKTGKRVNRRTVYGWWMGLFSTAAAPGREKRMKSKRSKKSKIDPFYSDADDWNLLPYSISQGRITPA